MQQVTSFVLTLLAASALSPEEYGTYTLSVLFVTLLQTLLFSGLFHYVIRTNEESEDDNSVANTCFWLTVILACVGSIVLFLAAPALARLFNAPEMTFVLRCLAVVQPILGYTAWASAMLLRQKRMTTHFNILFVQNLLAFGVGTTLLFIWPSIMALVVYRLVRVCTGCALYMALSQTWPGIQMRMSTAVSAIRFSYPIYGTRFLSFASNYGADLALGFFFTTAEAGLYRFGSRLASGTLDIVGQPMRSFALTHFGAAQRNNSPLAPIVERFTATTLLLMGCAAASVFVFAEDLIVTYFCPEYAAALIVVYAMTVRSLTLLGNFFVEPVLASTGDTKIAFVYHAAWAIILTAATINVASQGLNVLAWTIAALSLASSVSGFWIVTKYTGASRQSLSITVLKSAAIVLIYFVLSKLLYSFVELNLGTGSQSLFIGIFLSGLCGLIVLIAATKAGLFHLKIFSG